MSDGPTSGERCFSCLGNSKHAGFIFIFRGEKKGKKFKSFLPLADGLQQKQLEETGDLSKSIFHMMC